MKRTSAPGPQSWLNCRSRVGILSARGFDSRLRYLDSGGVEILGHIVPLHVRKALAADVAEENRPPDPLGHPGFCVLATEYRPHWDLQSAAVDNSNRRLSESGAVKPAIHFS
jgi:hypothetical protein